MNDAYLRSGPDELLYRRWICRPKHGLLQESRRDKTVITVSE